MSATDKACTALSWNSQQGLLRSVAVKAIRGQALRDLEGLRGSHRVPTTILHFCVAGWAHEGG